MTQPIHPMLERVARNMWSYDYQGQMFRVYHPDRPLYLARARAAVQALMEPDEGMLEAGHQAMWSRGALVSKDELPAGFRAMLQPLVEGEGE